MEYISVLSFLSSSSNISNNDISLYITNPQLWIETPKLLFVHETTLAMCSVHDSLFCVHTVHRQRFERLLDVCGVFVGQFHGSA